MQISAGVPSGGKEGGRAGGQATTIFLLTCDASGVLPPIPRPSPDQAIYHFFSGDTSKIAGPEIGLGTEPRITFSTCFWTPFVVHHPFVYANMPKDKMEAFGPTCWVINTGWTGGPFGTGKRIGIQHTRALLAAALLGGLAEGEFRKDEVFGFEVAGSCPAVPEEILDPEDTWGDKDEHWDCYYCLAARFNENFKLFLDACPEGVEKAGPRRVKKLSKRNNSFPLPLAPTGPILFVGVGDDWISNPRSQAPRSIRPTEAGNEVPVLSGSVCIPTHLPAGLRIRRGSGPGLALVRGGGAIGPPGTVQVRDRDAGEGLPGGCSPHLQPGSRFPAASR